MTKLFGTKLRQRESQSVDQRAYLGFEVVLRGEAQRGDYLAPVLVLASLPLETFSGLLSIFLVLIADHSFAYLFVD